MLIDTIDNFATKMGTNYYIHIKHCRWCGRFDKVHLGKRSAGWKFHFALDNFGEPKEWKTWLMNTPGDIYSEYGEKVPHWQFIDMVELKQSIQEPTPDFAEDSMTIEINGYMFVKGEFS
jgi:hypothetical protein